MSHSCQLVQQPPEQDRVAAQDAMSCEMTTRASCTTPGSWKAPALLATCSSLLATCTEYCSTGRCQQEMDDMQSHSESGAVDGAVGVDRNGDQDVQDHRQPAAVNECISEQLLVALHRLLLVLLQLQDLGPRRFDDTVGVLLFYSMIIKS